MSCNRPEWYGCSKTLSQIVVRSLRHVVAPRMSCDVWYPHHSQVPNASFFSVVRPSLVRAAHTRGGGNVRDVVLRRTSQSPCLVDSEQPMTVHPVMGKTPSQIGQTSLFLALWSPFTNMGCAAPAMDVFVSSLIARGMGVLVDVDAYHVHRSPITFTVRLLFVFSRLLSSSWVGSSVSVSPRECPSSCVTRTLGCSSESVPASTGQQLNAPHLPE